MKCKHMHKDAPEKAVCEDCMAENKHMGYYNQVSILYTTEMKGGKNGK